jgi:hypothetical protein
LVFLESMPTIEKIRNKYPEDLAIQCVCDAFPCERAPIAMRARAPKKVLEALMWNRGIHMVLAGVPHQYPPHYSVNKNEVWKDVVQIAIDAEVFDEDNVVIVRETRETPHGVLIRFDTPTSTKASVLASFRKKILKIRRKFAEFDSWGETVFVPHAP